MCYDLAEFDPFEPILIAYSDGYQEIWDGSEPMSDEDWEEWLANDHR